MKKGLAYPSTATRALEKQGAFGLNDLETAYALSAPFVAGTGTVGVVEFSLPKRSITHGLCRLLGSLISSSVSAALLRVLLHTELKYSGHASLPADNEESPRGA